MNRNRCPLSLLLAVALPALAQPAAAPTPPAFRAPAELAVDAAPSFDVFADADLAGRADERLVKGAPYCADAIHETVQPLLDAAGQAGNRIVRQTKTTLCRDGEGRTRQEVERGGRRQVILRDPIARETWVLDTERKRARRSGAVGWGVGGALAVADSAGWHDYAERVRDWARGYVERVRSGAPRAASAPGLPTPPASPTVPEAELVALARGATVAAEQALRDAELRVVRLHSIASAPPAPAAVAWTAHMLAPRGSGAVTSLGTKDLEGLRVHGERTTWTIEAGKVGNERPIQIVREVWTSPELMLTVAVRDFDPRRGETNYRLTNLKRGEPDPALMQVPADYTRSGVRAAASAPKG
ncbi:MAG TPA: hypothetical protein VFQ20_11955 [Burkholderiaceae bacterium]|nr:hypothetical protein [Burkholderiaceae bacterium]